MTPPEISVVEPRRNQVKSCGLVKNDFLKCQNWKYGWKRTQMWCIFVLHLWGERFCKSDLKGHTRIHLFFSRNRIFSKLRELTLNGDLTVHIRRAHTGEKLYLYKICGKWRNVSFGKEYKIQLKRVHLQTFAKHMGLCWSWRLIPLCWLLLIRKVTTVNLN